MLMHLKMKVFQIRRHCPCVICQIKIAGQFNRQSRSQNRRKTRLNTRKFPLEQRIQDNPSWYLDLKSTALFCCCYFVLTWLIRLVLGDNYETNYFMTRLPALPLLLATTRMSTKWLCFLNYFRSFIAFTGQSTIQFHWSEKKFFQWYRREKVCCIQRDSSHAKKLRLKFIIKSLSTRLPRFMQATRKWDNMSFSHCSCHTWPSCFVTEGCHLILKRLSTRLPTIHGGQQVSLHEFFALLMSHGRHVLSRTAARQFSHPCRFATILRIFKFLKEHFCNGNMTSSYVKRTLC